VLCAGCTETIEIVARFLALLELGREGRVSFDQPVALGELTVRWLPPGDGELHADFRPEAPSEFDDEPEPVE